jgi:hypothetical protein
MPTQWLESVGNCSLFDDFVSEALANLTYSTSTADGGTAAVGDEVGGVLTLVTSAATDTDNDENWLTTINEVFLCGNGRSIEGKARIQFAEAATNAANVFFGFGSAIGAANTLVDDGAGPRTSGNIIGIYKVDGDTVWRCVTRHGSTTNVTDTASTTTAGSSSYQVLEVSIADGGSSGSSLVTFRVDGVELKDSTGATIVHTFPNASATEMQFGIYAKQGSATPESVKIDKWFASQSY